MGITVSAQTQTAATVEMDGAETGPTIEEVQAFLPRVDAIIASREERATRLLNDIKGHDQRIEAGIGSLRRMLAQTTDSGDSKTRVARLKQDFIQGLGKAAEAYARKRAEVEESLRHANNPYAREDLFKARGALDGKIEKRVEDIMAVAVTFDAHENLEKYIYRPGYDSNTGWDGIWEDNPEFEQNRRASREGRQARADVVEGLEKSIDRLELRIKALQQSERENPVLPEPAQSERDAEKARLQKMLEERVGQRDTLRSQPEPVATAEVSLKEAIRMDEEIETTANDLRRDFTALFQSFREWQAVRAELDDAKARRDRAADWLEKQAPADAP